MRRARAISSWDTAKATAALAAVCAEAAVSGAKALAIVPGPRAARAIATAIRGLLGEASVELASPAGPLFDRPLGPGIAIGTPDAWLARLEQPATRGWLRRVRVAAVVEIDRVVRGMAGRRLEIAVADLRTRAPAAEIVVSLRAPDRAEEWLRWLRSVPPGIGPRFDSAGLARRFSSVGPRSFAAAAERVVARVLDACEPCSARRLLFRAAGSRAGVRGLPFEWGLARLETGGGVFRCDVHRRLRLTAIGRAVARAGVSLCGAREVDDLASAYGDARRRSSATALTIASIAASRAGELPWFGAHVDSGSFERDDRGDAAFRAASGPPILRAPDRAGRVAGLILSGVDRQRAIEALDGADADALERGLAALRRHLVALALLAPSGELRALARAAAERLRCSRASRAHLPSVGRAPSATALCRRDHS